MIVTDKQQKIEKAIDSKHIQMVEVEPSGNPDYPWLYQVWQHTIMHKFKSKVYVNVSVAKDSVLSDCIELYTFVIHPKM